MIHSPVPVRGVSNATPAILKEAVFQILEVRLDSKALEWVFFDLCAGSGQMAFEALSQGYGEVHLCELDQTRFSSILKEVKRYDFPIILHKKDFLKLVPIIIQKDKSVIFLDLPYSYWKDGVCSQIQTFLDDLNRSCLEISSTGNKIRGLICIQGQVEFIPDERLQFIRRLSVRSYGNNVLTLLEFRID